MSIKQWPYPQDSVNKRSRKMALTYRQVAREQHQALLELQKILAGIDSRIIGWIPDPQTILAIQDFVRTELPDAVAELDQRFADWGETWHAEIVTHHGDDEMVTAKEAGALIHCSPQTLTRARNKGLIAGQFIRRHGDNNGCWYFKVADVYTFDKTGRKGMWKKTDGTTTVGESGRSDAE